MSYGDRYRRHGNIQDLEAALKYGLFAVRATPEGDPGLPGRHQDLAWSYSDRYRRYGDLEDQETALKYRLLAVTATQQGHPELPGLYQDLAWSYTDRYKMHGELQDQEASLKYRLLAVTTTPEGHPSLPGRHRELAESLGDRYRRYRDLKDLDTAFIYALSAVAATPEGHPNLLFCYKSLAILHLIQYMATKDVRHLDNAYEVYTSALHSPAAGPQDLWDTAVSFTQQTQFFEPKHILDAYFLALNTLPSLLWLGHPMGTRHQTLLINEIPEVIAMAVSTSLEQAQLPHAIEFLEQGLSITHQQSLQLKLPHTGLMAQFSTQSIRLQQISTLLQDASWNPNPDHNYHLLANERQQLIAEIRNYSGFEDFLSPLKYSRLCHTAIDGPVVLLNCAEVYTDALIILSPYVPPLHLPLNCVSSEAKEQVENLRNALKMLRIPSRNRQPSSSAPTPDDYRAAQYALIAVNSWLWKFIVGPVFEVLGKVSSICALKCVLL
jgi:hypothetical protein